MIHGPCGDWCLIDEQCSKRYLRLFFEETKIDDNIYPLYHRRNNDKNVLEDI